jgi:histidinol-phosphate aminotransferase
MAYNRRDFLSTLGVGAAGAATIAVLPPLGPDNLRTLLTPRRPQGVLEGVIRLDKNENPAGPFVSARRAITGALADGGRYPGDAEATLAAAIAQMHHVSPERVVMGCGSSEILRLCTERCTSSTRGLVTAAPTFESPGAIAEQLGRPVARVAVTRDLRLDLDAMAVAAKGAGLVFLCNPNNPTSTVHGAAAVRAFITRVRRESPQTYILVDEAYHEYVDDPAYASMVPETKDAHVIVSRTFSKVFGLAGIRVGYAIAAPETAQLLSMWRLDSGVNRLAAVAALASLSDTPAMRSEQRRNRDVRAMVTQWFISRGFKPAKSDANFLFVDIKRDVRPVIDKCFERGVAVGRPFPPLDTHLRLTIGTEVEMDKALQVLGKILV